VSDEQGLVRRIKELEAEVSRLRERAAIPYRTVVEDMSELIVRWKPDGTRMFVNDAYCRLFGKTRESLIGTTFWPLISDQDREEVRARIATLSPSCPVTSGQHRAIGADGRIIWMEWVDRAIFDEKEQLVELQSVGRDITKRVHLEEDARRLAGADAAARAIESIAHDLRNVLQVMSGVTAVLDRGRVDAQDVADLHGAMRAAKDLMTRLEDVSHGRVTEPIDVDLCERVEKLSGLLKAMIGARIKLECKLYLGPCRIKGDPTQVDQILLNLVRNAWDAMPKGGIIVIETDVSKTPRLATGSWPKNAGPCVLLRVSDDGSGISATLLPTIFDPRVTTKPRGQGLGLATVRSIVEGHNGTVSVESSPGNTVFEIAFPLVVPEL
jgi:PAS domain S-box-containing protein